MGEIGKVTEIIGEDILVSRKRANARTSRRICARGRDNNEMTMRARNACNATVGDLVEIELQEGALIKAAATTYGIPLAAMLAGFGAGHLLGGEVAAFSTGIVLMGVAYVAIRILEKSGRLAKKYVPVAVRLVVKTKTERND